MNANLRVHSGSVPGRVRKTAVVQRCQGHKRENVVSDLVKNRQQAVRRQLQAVYRPPRSGPETQRRPRYHIGHHHRTRSRDSISSQHGIDSTCEKRLRYAIRSELYSHKMDSLVAEYLEVEGCLVGIVLERRCVPVDEKSGWGWSRTNARSRMTGGAIPEAPNV